MKLTYRPEIDGLRAIAVGAVIFYHAKITILGFQPFKGGYIGVDIFFVISGYLITALILNELNKTGNFSLKYFYERRVRRIIPALLFVIILSFPFAWIYLLPNPYVDYSKSILYSLGLSSNFYFHYSGQEYAAESSLLKPFIHTWSLSIEEQFYILFPLFLLLIFKFYKKYLFNFLVILFFISFVFSEWGSRNFSSFSFYFLPSRGWELLSGSLMAYLKNKFYEKRQSKLTIKIFPFIGLLFIMYSFFFFNDKTIHPSIFTLLPVVGTCLIIWFSQKGEFITKILSSKLFVGIGLISYSLYLWHYPLFAFNRITSFTDGDILKKLGLIVILFFISIFSYQLIEKPSRNRNFKFKKLLMILILCFFSILFLNFSVVYKKGFSDRIPNFILNNYEEKPWDLLKNEDNNSCHNLSEMCFFNSDSKKNVITVGDSQIASLNSDLKNKLLKKDYSFITSTVGACLFFPKFDLVEVKTKKIDPLCNQSYFSILENFLINQEDSVIIFGGRMPLFLSNQKFNNQEGGIEGYKWDSAYVSNQEISINSSFKKAINKISKKNKVILIYPIPEVGINVPQKLYNLWTERVNKFSDKIDTFTTSYKVFIERSKDSFDLYDSISNKNIYRVYPHKLFCDTVIKDRCLTHDENNSFYYDSDHPSQYGAQKINKLILDMLKKIDSE